MPTDRDVAAVESWLRAADDTEGRTLGNPFEAEERRERDWTYLEGEAREFVQRYGTAAMLRCVSRACE